MRPRGRRLCNRQWVCASFRGGEGPPWKDADKEAGGLRPTGLVVIGCVFPVLTGAAMAQPEAQVDRTDPAAVATAYAQAVAAGDATRALALVADDENRPLVETAVRRMTESIAGEGFDFWEFLRELLLLPVGDGMTSEAGPPEGAGDVVTVPWKRTFELQATLVLRRQADGTYGVDIPETIKRSTGRERSSVLATMGGSAPGGASGENWECRNRITRLAEALREYAEEHDGLLPPAENWCDALLPYLDGPLEFRCPEAPDLACGYVYNSALAGQALPEDWQERATLVLLFESDAAGWNAAAPFADEPTTLGRHEGVRAVALADHNARWLPAGTTLAALLDAERQAQREADTCQQHISALHQATMAYVEEQGGRLPAAQAWCDDIAPYLPAEPGPEAFRCPSHPELRCAYALNQEVAGHLVEDLKARRRIVLLLERGEESYNVAAALPELDTLTGPHQLQTRQGGFHVVYLAGNGEFRGPGFSYSSWEAGSAARPEYDNTQWECESNLRALIQGLDDYATEHDGALPPADTWCDAVLPYVLDRAVFRCPAAPGLACGYALNSEVAGQPLPPQADRQARRATAVLYESDLGTWNAAAPVTDVTGNLARHGDAIRVATADDSIITLPRNVTLAELLAADDETTACQQRVTSLCQAARDYAGEHGGLLPPGDTWSDDLALYLLNRDDQGSFQCPSRPDLTCGYVLSQEVAGKDITAMVGYRRIVLFFETDDEGYNVAAPPTLGARELRHRSRWDWGATRGGYHVGYLDGHTEYRGPGDPVQSGR